MILDDYLDLITSAWRQKPKFVGTLSVGLDVFLQIQNVMNSMLPKFDVDNAVGDQLDIIGELVGVSRNVSIPIVGIYFSWDGTDDTVGWDYGTWKGNLSTSDITKLPDDAYRTLIRAKIAANKWIGTTEDAYKIWSEIFPTITILIQDHQDMSYSMILVGGIVDSLTLALLTGGYLPLKPEGVRITEYFVPVDSNPGFGWDVESAYIGGWDEASWLREIPA